MKLAEALIHAVLDHWIARWAVHAVRPRAAQIRPAPRTLDAASFIVHHRTLTELRDFFVREM
jgi:hypothetical protein